MVPSRRDFLTGRFSSDDQSGSQDQSTRPSDSAPRTSSDGVHSGEPSPQESPSNPQEKIAAMEQRFGIDLVVADSLDDVEVMASLEGIEQALSVYSPNFFQNMMLLRYNLLRETVPKKPLQILLRKADDDVEVDNYILSGYALLEQFSIFLIPLSVKYDDSILEQFDQETLRLLIQKEMRETFQHELGHMVHYLFGNLSSSTYNPDEVFFNFDAGSPSFNWDDLDQRFSNCAVKYPGFVSSYSLANSLENFGETYKVLFQEPEAALARMRQASSDDSEFLMKYVTVVQMLEIISGGAMGKGYFEALAAGEIDEEYWENHQEKEFYHFDAGRHSAFTMDLNPLSDQYLPASVAINLSRHEEEREAAPSAVYQTTIDGLDCFFKLIGGTDEVILISEGVPMSFCILPPGVRAQISISTIEGTTTLLLTRYRDGSYEMVRKNYEESAVKQRLSRNQSRWGWLFAYSSFQTGVALGSFALSSRSIKQVNANRSFSGSRANYLRRREERWNDDYPEYGNSSISRRGFLRAIFALSSLVSLLAAYNAGLYWFNARRIYDDYSSDAANEWYQNRGPGPYSYECVGAPREVIAASREITIYGPDSPFIDEMVESGEVNVSDNNALADFYHDLDKSYFQTMSTSFEIGNERFDYSEKHGFFVLAAEFDRFKNGDSQIKFSKIVIIDRGFLEKITYAASWVRVRYKNIVPGSLSLHPGDVDTFSFRDSVREGERVQLLDIHHPFSGIFSYAKFSVTNDNGEIEDKYIWF